MPKHSSGHHGLEAFGLGALSLGAVVSAIAGGYKFAEFLVKAKKLHEVAGENAVFVRIIQRVQVDLIETDRLLALPEVKRALSKSPQKVTWIRKTISALRESLEEMAGFTEHVQRDVDRGRRVGLRNRLRWVLDEHEKLVHARMEVAMNHLGLIQVLGFLSALEPLACCQPDGEYDEADRFVQESEVEYKETKEYDRPKHGERNVDEGFYEGEEHPEGEKGRKEEYITVDEVRFMSLMVWMSSWLMLYSNIVYLENTRRPHDMESTQTPK
jgi:hypothetical protein